MKDVKLTIVYDNKLYDQSLQSGWGFSCLVEGAGKKTLFDTGDNAKKLAANLKKLAIDPQKLDAIALSHEHWDHIDGLSAVLGKGQKYTLYFGKSYSLSFQQGIKAKGVDFQLVDEMISIAEGIYLGPEMSGPGPKEIPLTVDSDKGLVVITGCAHPGILEMAQKVKAQLGKDIYLVLGGFHLGMSSKLQAIVEGLKKIGVRKAAPCHCTGEAGVTLFREIFKDDFIAVGAGLKIEV